MNSVYVVTHWHYTPYGDESREARAAFTTKEKALEWMAANPVKRDTHYESSGEEWDELTLNPLPE